MTRVRRGGYLFVAWEGDHPPRHLHVYRDRALVAKWDLEEGRWLGGTVPPKRIERLLRAVLSRFRSA